MGQHYSGFLIRSLALIMLLLLVAASFGCGNSPGGSGDSDGNGDGTSSGPVASMMEKLPKDALVFDFTDVAAVRSDIDFDELYDAYQNDVESEYAVLGVSPGDVDREGVQMGANGTVRILEGRFDLDSMRNEMKNSGYKDGEYQGIETWESATAGEEMKAVALAGESCIVVASSIDRVRDSIDVIKGDEDSLGDNEGFSAVVGRLPAGVVVHVSAPARYEGCEAYGLSIAKNDPGGRRLTEVFLFVDKDTADSTRDDIERDFREYYEHEDIEVTLDGRYIVLTVDTSIDTSPA